MEFFLIRSSLLRAMTLFVVLMTSCTYQYWVKPDDIDISQSETVYRLVTLDGDTISFAGSHFIEGERNRLTGVSRNEFVGYGGIYNGGIVSGVDSNGGEISFLEENISALEIPNRTAMIGTVSIIIVSIPAVILLLNSLIKYDRMKL